MCEKCPPTICRLCGNEATIVLVCVGDTPGPENLFCEEHGAAVMARAEMMERTAALN